MKKQLLETLQRAKEYTLAVADAMPENHYSFKPMGAIWNFADLMNHISYGLQWWQATYLLGKDLEWEPPVTSDEKSEVIKNLQKVFKELEVTCENLSFSNNTEVMGFHSTLDHVTHHRGQAVIYLRCNDIIPPEYFY